MSKVEWLGQVRFENGPWIPCGRFAKCPTVDELRTKAWDVAASRPKGTPLPVEVRAVEVIYQPMDPRPFQ